MTGIFHFRCLTPCFPRSDAVLVLFSGPTAFDRNALTDAVTRESRKALAPEAAYLLYPSDLAPVAVADLTKNMDVFAPLPEDAAIGVYQYDGTGRISLLHALQGAPSPNLSLDHVRRQGLTALFRRHGGALDAGPTAHFVRPSARPSTRFLRASHALSDGTEIYFAALWLLPHLPDEISYVHLDTSAIASVVLAALVLKRVAIQPTILTFHSYGGLKGHPFSVDRSDLVLISASQSGTMANDICSLVADGRRVLTLFSSADAPGETTVLCDIRYDEVENSGGFPEARELGDVSKTRPIRLISEHFSVEPEPPRAIVPTIRNLPQVLKTLAQFVGHKVILALRATDLADERNSVWIDMQALATLPTFQEWVERVTFQHVPATTRALVQIEGDAQSGVLGDAIHSTVTRHGGKLHDVARLTLVDVESGVRDWAEPGSPIIITGATAGRGTQLLAASRALRRFAPDSYRIFLAPGIVGMTARSIELLRRNLEQPSFRFETMFELVVDRETCARSWKEERMLLEDLDRGDAPAAVEARIMSLSSHSEGRTDGLFLAAPIGDLRLRDNFAFWPRGVACTAASQADVFTTVCAIMEHLRTDSTHIDQRLSTSG